MTSWNRLCDRLGASLLIRLCVCGAHVHHNLSVRWRWEHRTSFPPQAFGGCCYLLRRAAELCGAELVPTGKGPYSWC